MKISEVSNLNLREPMSLLVYDPTKQEPVDTHKALK